MYFKPINERMLEHLVVSEFFAKEFKLEYGGTYEKSRTDKFNPDVILIDRNNLNEVLNCELKFKSKEKSEKVNINDYKNHCNFDISIIWDEKLTTHDLEILKFQLGREHNCKKVINLVDEKKFISKLLDFDIEYLKKLSNTELKTYYSKIEKLNTKKYFCYLYYAIIHDREINKMEFEELINTKIPELKIEELKGAAPHVNLVQKNLFKRIMKHIYVLNTDTINRETQKTIIKSEFIKKGFENYLQIIEDFNYLEYRIQKQEKTNKKRSQDTKVRHTELGHNVN